MIRSVLIVFFVLFVLNGFSQSKTVQIDTRFGTMKFLLYDDTPKHRDAFIQLVNEGYFEYTLLYGERKNSLIQSS